MEEKAFNEGYDAFGKGVDLDANPYKMTQFEFTDWENGWLKANDDEIMVDYNAI